jgi:hypothetical protein
MKKFNLIGLLAILFSGLTFSPLQADFIQCPGDACAGTINADVVNGTELFDDITSDDGDDIIFGGAEDDRLFSELGNDIIFGGLGSDDMDSGPGDDILLGGPDAFTISQRVDGDEGNDVINVFAGETANCLRIFDGGGTNDVVNLIGFGPYSLVEPFGQPELGEGFIYLIDPIAGGDIYIEIRGDVDDEAIEIVNGLPNPSITIIPGDEIPVDCVLED